MEEQSLARFSRCGKMVRFLPKFSQREEWMRCLIEYCRRFDLPPVLYPCSDSAALALAQNKEKLRGCSLFSSSSLADLERLVSKDRLYALAEGAGIPTVPSIISGEPSDIAAWSDRNVAPYLLKPFFEGNGLVRSFEKNRILVSREELIAFTATNEMKSIIVQRMIQGGDGFIFDCYGYCDRQGAVITMASHRRLRQHPPNFGSTSLGEIPAGWSGELEQNLFTQTLKLFKCVPHHGIFGVEWLFDKISGELHLIDVNARPFLTIGHLFDCGLNLPKIAYLELSGQSLNSIELTPKLQKMQWIDLSRDLESLYSSQASAGEAISKWLKALVQSKSFGSLAWRDPVPGIAEALRLLAIAAGHASRRIRG